MSKKVKKIQIINKKVIIATIDIGKNKSTGYWRYNNISTRPFEFSNNREGLKRFWQEICSAKIINNADEVIVGFEPTGGYERPLVHYLSNKPVNLVQINPVHTKRTKELNDNSPLKTDMKDPKVIADIIQLGHYLSVVIPKGASAQLRNLVNSRERTIKNRTMQINRLHKLVYMIFPEFLEIMKTVSSKSSMHLLQYYPNPDDIVTLGFESLALSLRKTSRGRFNTGHAERLLNAAKTSIGIKEGIDSIIMEIQQIIKEICSFDNFINKIEMKMKHYLNKIPESQYVLSIKGIGEVTAAGIFGEVGSFNNFHNQRAILKLAGLNLFEVSSGNKKGIKHISKRGRSLLRKILFFASLNVVRKGGIMHDYYHKLIDNGMKKKKALIAVSRKLLKLIFSLVRKRRYYINNYEMKSVA